MIDKGQWQGMFKTEHYDPMTESNWSLCRSGLPAHVATRLFILVQVTVDEFN